jgi:preprotein translocase SecF subunit
VFDVIGKRNWFFLFSGLILVPGLIFIALTPITGGKSGLQFSIDYTGGTVVQVKFVKADVSIDDVRAAFLKYGVTDVDVSEDSAQNFTIHTKQEDLFPKPTPIPPTPTPVASPSAGASASASASPSAVPSASPSASSSAAASAVASASASAVASASASAASASASAVASAKAAIVGNSQSCVQLPNQGKLSTIVAAMAADPKIGPIACTLQTNTVGPIISTQLITQTIELILLGSLGILIWVGFRFGSIKFGATALVALLHDVIVVVGLFAIMGTLFGVQIDALFVTAMLTVIGFSVHDTIVVYDRIRENKTRHAGEPFDQIVNHSILQTFGRSINTSLTVVITLTALLLFAGASIHYFVLALLIGIISGTYSSIFNASPLLVVWQLWEDHRRAERMASMRGVRRA